MKEVSIYEGTTHMCINDQNMKELPIYEAIILMIIIISPKNISTPIIVLMCT